MPRSLRRNRIVGAGLFVVGVILAVVVFRKKPAAASPAPAG
jgi:hypothetical protein